MLREDSKIKVIPAGSSNEVKDVDLPGVRVFNVVQGEALPKGTFLDPEIHTIIRNNTDTGMSSIAKRRNEEAQVRDFLDPITFRTVKVETVTWDATYLYKGTTIHDSFLVPTQELPPIQYSEDENDPST